MELQAAYVPIAVPAETHPSHPGRAQSIIGVVCAVISLLFFPPVFGIAGIVLGSMAISKGEKTLGIIAVILSAVFMVIGMVLGVVLSDDFEKSGGFILGPIINFF